MTKSFTIPEKTNEDVVNVVLDTLEKSKQALVFVNAKRSAEKVAEDIVKFLRKNHQKTNPELSNTILHVLSKPTRQCEKLAELVQYQIAFHHAGLASKQKELIEDNFRTGKIKIICATPTLAAGVDLPAFRTIIRDVKRFSQRGYNYIPVLEYLQQAGRAGRPKYDTEGESIVITSTEKEREEITDRYVHGEPENITSKLAVEPVLRTYVLSLIASGFVSSRKELLNFFSKTFWAHQFEDMKKLETIIDKMIRLLSEFKFIKTKQSDFVSADEMQNDAIHATEIGRRVAQLYIDPLTAHKLLEGLGAKMHTTFALIQMISDTLEMRPLLNVKSRENNEYTALVVEHEDELLTEEPDMFEPEYDDFLNSIKTTQFFMEWMDEKDDEYMLENFDVRPGESRAKLDVADWLLYSWHELAKMNEHHEFAKEFNKLRLRMKYGAKEELLTLLQLKEIGRVRARKMFNNGIKDLGDVKKIDFGTLKQLLGESVARTVKEQVGDKMEGINETKRKGQMSLKKYSNKN